MTTNLKNLPPPPKGQKGITFDQLPKPPKGQQGMTLDQIQSQTPPLPPPPQPMHFLTNPQGGFGTALKDVAVGAGKDLLRTARDTAGLLQGGGKAVLGAFGANTSNMGFNSLDNSTPEGTGVENTLASKSRGEQVGGVLSTVAQVGAGFASKEGQAGVKLAKQGYETYQAGKEAKATADATGKVTEMISPKATAKEAKLAQTQGRLVQGKEPTLFRGGTEDKILPSKKTLSASDTIVKNIPNASKMKPPELYKAVDETITKSAQKLRPQMEATPIKPETVDKINNDWEALKKTQIADAPATEEANVAKRQAKFEATLRKSGSGTHADLWDTRIAYDNSVSDAVKKANQMSPESLQLQKDEWLQNRKILSDAIDSSGKPEMKVMSDLYNAKTGLLSQTKLEGAQLSKIKQMAKDHPEAAKAIKYTLYALGAEKLLKGTTGLGF